MIFALENTNAYQVYLIKKSDFNNNITSNGNTLTNREIERQMIQYLLQNTLGDESKLYYLDSGRPMLMNNPYRISISHSDAMVAVQLSDQFNPGIDAESMREKLRRVKHKFLSEEEINNCMHKNELLLLCLHWSAKEAIYKSAGIAGLSLAKQIRVNDIIFEKESTGIISADLFLESKVINYELKFKLLENKEVIVYIHQII